MREAAALDLVALAVEVLELRLEILSQKLQLQLALAVQALLLAVFPQLPLQTLRPLVVAVVDEEELELEVLAVLAVVLVTMWVRLEALVMQVVTVR